jgi:hypothetical protein
MILRQMTEIVQTMQKKFGVAASLVARSQWSSARGSEGCNPLPSRIDFATGEQWRVTKRIENSGSELNLRHKVTIFSPPHKIVVILAVLHRCAQEPQSLLVALR